MGLFIFGFVVGAVALYVYHRAVSAGTQQELVKNLRSLEVVLASDVAAAKTHVGILIAEARAKL